MSDSNKNQDYKQTKEYAQELFAKGMCMGEVMKKTRLTEEQIAKTRKELDEEE
jgi:hypothetical protein